MDYVLHTNLHGDYAYMMTLAARSILHYSGSEYVNRTDLHTVPLQNLHDFTKVTLADAAQNIIETTLAKGIGIGPSGVSFSPGRISTLLGHRVCYEVFQDQFGEVCLKIFISDSSDKMSAASLREEYCLTFYEDMKEALSLLLKLLKTFPNYETKSFRLTAVRSLRFRALGSVVEMDTGLWELGRQTLLTSYANLACFTNCIWNAAQELRERHTWFTPRALYSNQLEEVQAVLKQPEDDPFKISQREVKQADLSSKIQKFIQNSEVRYAELITRVEKIREEENRRLRCDLAQA